MSIRVKLFIIRNSLTPADGASNIAVLRAGPGRSAPREPKAVAAGRLVPAAIFELARVAQVGAAAGAAVWPAAVSVAAPLGLERRGERVVGKVVTLAHPQQIGVVGAVQRVERERRLRGLDAGLRAVAAHLGGHLEHRAPPGIHKGIRSHAGLANGRRICIKEGKSVHASQSY